MFLKSIRFVCVFHLIALLCFVICDENVVVSIKRETTYKPTWESLDTRPIPEWYDAAKVGIFLHWGVYSVPTFGSEWFWTNWINARDPWYIEYMKKNFKPGFTYQEFGPLFTAEHFNPYEWAELFEKSGAK